MNAYVFPIITGALGAVLGIVITRAVSRRAQHRTDHSGFADFAARCELRNHFYGWFAGMTWTCVSVSKEQHLHAGTLRIATIENSRGERIRLKCSDGFSEGDKAILIPLTDDQLRSGYWISLADEALRIVKLNRNLAELMKDEPSLSGARLTRILRDAGLTPDEAADALIDKGFTVQREEQPWGTILHVSQRPTKAGAETVAALMGASSEVAWHHKVA
jgi:hypothetical protein